MRNRFVLVADIVAVAAAAFLAFLVHFDWHFLSYRLEFWRFVALAIVLKVPVFYFFGLYAKYWRYASMREAGAIIVGGSAGTLFFDAVASIGLAVGFLPELSRVVLLADFILTVVALGGVRFGVRALGEAQERRLNRVVPTGGPAKRVLIVGAGEAGSLILRELHRNPQLQLLAVGFLDDAPSKQQKQIYGVRVLGTLNELAAVCRRENVEEVVVALPRAGGDVVRRIVDQCRAIGVRSRAIPGIFELLDGPPTVRQLRDVDIADLLRRPQVTRNGTHIEYLKGRTVMVTGAGGSIGRELCRQVAHVRPARLVMLGHGENSLFEARELLHESFPDVPLSVVLADIRDAGRINRVFEQFQPSVVFNAAAHKHVPLMEENPEEAVTNNILGTARVLDAALRVGTERFVQISTDKAVSPTSIMGATKLAASLLVRRAGRIHKRAFVSVRFGNVLGSRGSVVPSFKRRIEQRRPIVITHPEMRRFFMTIDEAVHLVLQAGGIGRGGELFVLNMGEPVRIVDLAKDLIRLAGETPERVPIVFTEPRPGEKLEERLWEDGAIIEPTSVPDILKVHESMSENLASFPTFLRALEDAAQEGDQMKLTALLCDLMPGFRPELLRAEA